MNGRTYARGLAVHSRCVLTYDLECTVMRPSRPWSVSMSRHAARAGSIAGSSPTRRRSTPTPTSAPATRPRSFRWTVAAAQQLRLMVDFGRGQDTGDRVIWADARLYRPAPPRPSEAKEPVDIPKPTTEIPSSKP